MPTEATPDKRRHLSGSAMLLIAIGALIVMAIVPAIPWYVRGHRRAVAQRELREVGVHIDYSQASDWWPSLGRELFGSESEPYFDSVTEIRISQLFNDSHVLALSQFDEAKALTIYGAGMSDEGAAVLAGFQELRRFTLRAGASSTPHLTRAVLKHVAAMRQLEELFVIGLGTTDEDVPLLEQLTALHTLNLGECEITDEGLAAMARTLRLRKLELGSPGLTDAAWEHIAAMKSLESLILHPSEASRISGVGIAKLRALPRLQELLLNVPVTDAQLAEVQHFPALTALGVSGTGITDVGVMSLPVPVKWRKILFPLANITDASAGHLGRMTSLNALHLASTGITDAGLARLSTLTELRTLILADTAVTDAGLVHLAGMTELTVLNLDDTQISDAGLARLAKLPKLHVLDVSNCKITDAGLAHLRGSSDLQFITARGTSITPRGIADLKKARPNLEVSK